MIINNLKNDSIIKHYIDLIKALTNKMEEESRIKCELLVSTPYKYKELVYTVDTTFSLSPLPKEASEFYALKNYKQNKINFENFVKPKDPVDKLREEFSQKLNDQNVIISGLNSKIVAQEIL